jgi:hypothetical protein
MTDKLVSRIEEIPLSGDDLIKIARCLSMNRSIWMLYDDLAKFSQPDEIFKDKYEAIYVLLQIKSEDPTKSAVGHWVCFIFHREKNEYYWYDSYGIPIAKELSLTHEPDTILKLTKNVNLGMENKHRHQMFRDDVNTCGRHCVLRSVFWHLDNDEYNRFVISPMVPRPIHTADNLVALLTGLAAESDRILIQFFNKKEDTSKHNTKSQRE